MMDIKVIFCVVLIIVSMANNSQGQGRKKRSPHGNPANAFSSASSFGNANAFAGASASASASSTGTANSFTSASTDGINPELNRVQNSWPDNTNFMNPPLNYPNNANNPPSTSWMIPPSINPINYNPSLQSTPSNNVPSLPDRNIQGHYTPVVSISGTFDERDKNTNYPLNSISCNTNNCNKNFNPFNTNPIYTQNYPNYRPMTNNNNNNYQPQQYPNQMGYNPSTYSKPNYDNTKYGNTGSNGGFASAGSFANGGVGGYPPSVNNQRYPGNNEINMNSRFGPGHDFDYGFGGNGADHFKWVQDQNQMIQAKIQAQIEHFRQLNNQQSHFGNAGKDWGSNGPNDAWAWGSANAAPSGGSQAGEIGPVGPGIESRFAEDVPSPGGDGSYSSFSSSSSSSKVGPDGKVISTKEVTTGVNNNGKVSVKTIKN